MLHRDSFALALALLGLLTAGCNGTQAVPSPVQTRASLGDDVSPGPRGMAIGEKLLDTGPTVSPTRPVAVAPSPAPVTTTRAPKIRKPGSDENLPSWVPLRGRLTVVEAPDLAENLGLVPRGTTRASATRVSVAETLAASPSATPAPARFESGPRSATWLASNGRVRHGRGR